MKNISKTVRAAILLLVLCMISTAMLGGTFAKYTSEYAGADTALVARWSFEAKGGDGDITMGADNTELALFDHLYSTHINQTDGAGKFILAPGVEDEFTVKMDYIADVDADVVIEITPLAGNANVPMEYSVDDGTNWVTLANLPNALAVEIASPGGALSDPVANDKTFRIAKVDANSTNSVSITQPVKWRWAYDFAAQSGQGNTEITSNDVTDTALGEASQAAVAGGTIANRTHYGIKIDITATQVAPDPVAATPVTAIAAIGGTTTVGETLTAGALTPGGAVVSYQWQRCATVDGGYVDIAGANGNTYVLTVDDEGMFIKVRATGVGSHSGTVISDATGSIAAAAD
ncbi:MAG: hypothetical protein ACOX0T_06060 [Pelotomaculum sp.]|jgi:hypothetical protein